MPPPNPSSSAPGRSSSHRAEVQTVTPVPGQQGGAVAAQYRGGVARPYPSGHGTFGAEVAILLAMMVPEKRSELFARGWQFGEQRIMSGVAYPSDWEAGHIGATVMVTLMLQKPEFKADFEATKAEVRKGLGLAP